MSEFFAMGGYAAFVWPSYGIAVVLIARLIVGSWWRHRRVKAMVAALEDEGAR